MATITEAFYVTFTATGTVLGHTNSVSDFFAPVPWLVQLGGRWECAVVDVSLEWPNSEERVYLCCDVSEESYVNANRVQLLRNVEKTGDKPTVKKVYLDPRYVQLIPGQREYFRFYLLNQNLSPVTSASQKLHCVCHFRPKNE